MFIRNPLSIKQKTIKVKDNDVYEFLSRHGITPLGKMKLPGSILIMIVLHHY